MLEEKLGNCSWNEVDTVTQDIIDDKQELELYNDEKVNGYILRAMRAVLIFNMKRTHHILAV